MINLLEHVAKIGGHDHQSFAVDAEIVEVNLMGTKLVAKVT